ncbi:hypothetical protein TNCV_1924381 [Trichonephila clavipes]|nr:hypothetical protein TNCV_1924381 [Trichonephila clavipes]
MLFRRYSFRAFRATTFCPLSNLRRPAAFPLTRKSKRKNDILPSPAVVKIPLYLNYLASTSSLKNMEIMEPIRGRRFTTQEGIDNAMREQVTRFTYGTANAETDGIQRLPHHLQRVVIVAGDCFEGL